MKAHIFSSTYSIGIPLFLLTAIGACNNANAADLCGEDLPIASVWASAEQSGNPPKNVLDGDLTTRWSGKGIGTQLTVKLAESTSVCSIGIAWYHGDERINNFSIAYSTDDATYTQVYKGVSGYGTDIQNYSFAPIDARYIRLTVNGNTINTWASILEFAVNGDSATNDDTSTAKPGPSNTGVPEGYILTPAVTDHSTGIYVDQSGNVKITKPGVFQGLLISGRLRIYADDVTIRYSRIEGTPIPSDLAKDPATKNECMAKGEYPIYELVRAFDRRNVLIEDSTIAASTQSISNGNAIHGSGYTLRRVDISGTIDGASVFKKFADTNVVIEDSYIHDLYSAKYEYGRGCTPSHSDGIQIHYGSNTIIRHNTITPNNDEANAAIMVDQAAADPNLLTSYLSIENNWLDYGACTINVCDKGKTPIRHLSISDNYFGNNRKHPNCAMIVNDATRADPTNKFDGNKWEDGHAPDPTITHGGNCSK
ncbi:MAG: discoidin domain-containing protein [Candidatus Thiodiazotropha sp.]|jgi:hypothetical protein